CATTSDVPAGALAPASLSVEELAAGANRRLFCAQKKGRGIAAALIHPFGEGQARPACFMTSEAKSSSCFSIPSPTARRTKLTTSAPAALRTCSTDWLVSSTYGWPVRHSSLTVLATLPDTI